MTSTQRLNFQLEEPGDDPLCDKVINVLAQVLQPENTTTLDAAVDQIVVLLPRGQPYSNEVGDFLTTCYEAAEQIPYDHPSMIKLVTVIDSCLNSPGLSATGDESKPANQRTIRPSTSTSKLLQLESTSVVLVNGPELAVWTLENAFEKHKGSTNDERDAYVQAASQWILVQGDVAYAEVVKGKVARKTWRGWREKFADLAARKAGKDGCVCSQRTAELAGKAAVAMESLEREKAS